MNTHFTPVPNPPKKHTLQHTTAFPPPTTGPGGARSFVGRGAALDHAAVPAEPASRGEPERGPDECERRSGDAAVRLPHEASAAAEHVPRALRVLLACRSQVSRAPGDTLTGQHCYYYFTNSTHSLRSQLSHSFKHSPTLSFTSLYFILKVITFEFVYFPNYSFWFSLFT